MAPDRHHPQPAPRPRDLRPRFGEFYRQLAYKADWYGAQVWAADRWFPSSRLCGGCGTVNAVLTLADRTWHCGCGAVHDRDVNAAHNLLTAMQQDQQPHSDPSPGSSPETPNACGGDVSPRPAGGRRQRIRNENH